MFDSAFDFGEVLEELPALSSHSACTQPALQQYERSIEGMVRQVPPWGMSHLSRVDALTVHIGHQLHRSPPYFSCALFAVNLPATQLPRYINSEAGSRRVSQKRAEEGLLRRGQHGGRGPFGVANRPGYAARRGYGLDRRKVLGPNQLSMSRDPLL